MFVVSFLILVYSVILHEISHGFVAEKLGDPTARLSGRLTLNPIPHIDPIMTIGLPLLLVLTHSPVIFGGAKPVPVDPFNFRDPKKDMALTALAGPMTNFLIAVVLAIIIRVSALFIVNDSIYHVVTQTLTTGVIWNVGLALFNLFPLPPLDGFKVLTGLVSDNLARDFYQFERYGFFIIILVLFFFPSLIFSIIGPIMHNLTALLLP